jgi:hypothetical protein
VLAAAVDCWNVDPACWGASSGISCARPARTGAISAGPVGSPADQRSPKTTARVCTSVGAV